MAKRYTDTQKWLDDWFVSLSPEHKALWIYICDTCDHAGIWKTSELTASRLIGSEVKLDDVAKAFLGRVVPLREGRWFVPNFLKFQYGLPLNRANKVHLSAIKALEKEGVDPAPYESQGAKDKDKDKDRDITSSTLLEPTTNTLSAFDEFWKAYPKRRARPAAYAAWLKMKPPLEQCLSTLEWQSRSEEWAKDDGKWIPWPQKWLNQARWEDERPASSAPVCGCASFDILLETDTTVKRKCRACKRVWTEPKGDA